MSHSGERVPNHISQLKKIDVEDLQYVERDLCFSELVSLGFLLFGAERTNAEFVLQKLLVVANTTSTSGSTTSVTNADLLRKYASINPANWRGHLVEALTIIGARRVLHKLGFQWESLRQHYLPHIAELSLHIHPLLKALYKVCERLPLANVGQLVLHINEEHKRPSDHLRFYDFAHLEIFLLDWLTRRIISLGDAKANGANLQVLLAYFKLNEMDALKMLLVGTINHNADQLQSAALPTAATVAPSIEADIPKESSNATLTNGSSSPQSSSTASGAKSFELEVDECYRVSAANAGYLLIINQRNFYEEPDEKLKHELPPKPLLPRLGTDEDKRKLKEVFTSFGYKAVEYEDLNHIELRHHIREIVKRSLLCDSLIVCILSHGIDGAVYGCNSIPVEISDIEKIITADTLLGKPKMLIVQACQKDEESQQQERKRKPTTGAYIKPDGYSDMIKAMSTVPGYVSMRHTKTGTWFIQSLCEAVQKLGDRKHMLDILIAVHSDVTNKRGDKNENMVPLTSHTLRKYFVLPKRTS